MTSCHIPTLTARCYSGERSVFIGLQIPTEDSRSVVLSRSSSVASAFDPQYPRVSRVQVTREGRESSLSQAIQLLETESELNPHYILIHLEKASVQNCHLEDLNRVYVWGLY